MSVSGDIDGSSHSPRTRGIIQHFVRQVRVHTEGFDADLQVANEKLGQLETTQIETNTKLAALETSVAGINTSLAALVRCFDDLNAGDGNQRQENNNNDDGYGEDNFDDEYSVDTEHDDREARLRRRLHRNRERMGRQREVRNNDDAFGKVKFKIPPFDGKYNPDAYITWEIVVDQKFACHEFPENQRVRVATTEFTDFASV